jgi:uncharacterized cupredoxin-like copper-binding protein
LALLGGCAKSNDAAHTDHSTTVAGAQTSTTVAGASTTSGPSTTIDHAHSDAGSTTTAFSRAKASAKIDLDLVDFSFVGMPAQASGPTLFFTAVNKGPSEHEIVIADQDGKELAAVKPFAKGDKRDLAVELQPGTYVIQCLVKQGDQTHAQLGMKNTFVVS